MKKRNIQKKTMDRLRENLSAVEVLINENKTSYEREDFKKVSQEMGISVARVSRAYNNLSEFGYINLSIGPIDSENIKVVPNKPVVKKKKVRRRRVATNYIKRKDENYVDVAKKILHDKIFTNMTNKEIASKYNCSVGRVSSLLSELKRYGGIKLSQHKQYTLIDFRNFKGINMESTVNHIKLNLPVSGGERALRHTLIVNVLKEALGSN